MRACGTLYGRTQPVGSDAAGVRAGLADTTLADTTPLLLPPLSLCSRSRSPVRSPARSPRDDYDRRGDRSPERSQD